MITADADLVAPGVQTDIHIRTSLQEGDLVLLEVLAADGESLDMLSSAVAADGTAVFRGVSVEPPRVTLRATGRGTCGIGRDEITVDVLAGATCAVSFAPAPEHNDHYAPLDVLSTRSDPDPLTPGYQTTVLVATRPGWSVEIFRTTTDEESLGVLVADAGGVAALPVTVLDGWVGFRATCQDAGTEVASRTVTLIADTTPPSCELLAPAPGATITPAFDEDRDLGDGLQLAIVGRAHGEDVAGEPAILAITAPDGAPVVTLASHADEAGEAAVSATLAPAETPATYDFALTMRDHAGNACLALASFDVVFNGCAIAVTAPTAPVSHDADGAAGNGSQVDVALAVAPACAGRAVIGQCGVAAASGVVGSDGRATVRVEVCDRSPCETEARCAFDVTAESGIVTHATATIVFDDVAPPAIRDLVAVAADRERLRLTWTAPADGARPAAAYILKQSLVPLTDANFDRTGTVVPTDAPGAPGSRESRDVLSVRTGAPHYVGIAAVDAAGNRSVVATAGPIVPVFDQTGAILPGSAAQGALALGSAIAHGKFNDDDFDDVAIAAPGENAGALARAGAVYIYFGGPTGLARTPGLKITSAEAGANLGAGLATVRWSSAARDDLVIGAPGADGSAGRIFVLRGGRTLGSGTRPVTSAELQVRVATRPGWFADAGLGSVLASADVDADGTLDLVASAPRGGASGGAVILYGGTVTGNVALSDLDASGANGAVAELFADPGTARGRRLGFYLHAVGPTRAGSATGDLAIAYADDYTTAGDSLYIVRGDRRRPSRAGVTPRPFAPGRDVRLDFATTSRITEWGSQVTSIEDQNGDGARELVIGAYRAQGDRGQVLIVSGNIVGTGGVARTSDPGVTLATINPAGNVSRLGAAIAAHDASSRPDVDGDGREDLVIAARSGASGVGLVWFGGAMPRGTVTSATAPYTIAAPSAFGFGRQRPQGFAAQARWIGDINRDGLADLCWASPFDNGGDGSFEVLWDAPP